MSTADESYEDEYSDYEEFEDDEEEGTLSGFSVLVIGLLMFGAFAAITWVAYQQGIKRGQDGRAIETPFVAADPEPMKIETADAGDRVADREVYDVFDGEDPEPVTVISDNTEEPVDRSAEDAIGSLAADAEAAAADVSDEVEDRLASLAEEDAQLLSSSRDNASADSPRPVTEPQPASATQRQDPVSNGERASVRSSGDALSGSHVVQVGAFRSNDEAMAQWSRMQSKLSNVLGDKTYDVERADLGERGVYHRLRVGPFASSSAASAYCASLKENGQDCLIKGL